MNIPKIPNKFTPRSVEQCDDIGVLNAIDASSLQVLPEEERKAQEQSTNLPEFLIWLLDTFEAHEITFDTLNYQSERVTVRVRHRGIYSTTIGRIDRRTLQYSHDRQAVIDWLISIIKQKLINGYLLEEYNAGITERGNAAGEETTRPESETES